MTADEEEQRRAFPELGVAIEVPDGWTPVVTRIGAVTYLVLTPPGEEGAVFVRSGPDETLEAFASGLGDALTTVEVLAESTVELAGRAARRLALRLQTEAIEAYLDGPEDGLVHEPQPERRVQIVVFEPSPPAGREPVLLGYRLPQERVAELAPLAERVVAGVRFD